MSFIMTKSKSEDYVSQGLLIICTKLFCKQIFYNLYFTRIKLVFIKITANHHSIDVSIHRYINRVVNMITNIVFRIWGSVEQTQQYIHPFCVYFQSYGFENIVFKFNFFLTVDIFFHINSYTPTYPSYSITTV